MYNYNNIDIQELKENILYEPETGNFYWLIEGHGRNMDYPIGYKSTKLYNNVTFNGIPIRMQKLAWFYMTGKWPDPSELIEPVDGNYRNLKWENLRAVDRRHSILLRMKRIKDIHREKEQPVVNVKPIKRATFTTAGVNKAVEEFIKNKVLVDGRYIPSENITQ